MQMDLNASLVLDILQTEFFQAVADSFNRLSAVDRGGHRSVKVPLLLK